MGKYVKTNGKKANKINFIWSFKLMIIAAIISIVLSFISEIAMKDVNLLVGTIIILIFIGLGILFDMIGVAVTSALEAPLHSMCSKKIKGAKMAIKLKKNSDKVSSFCCDVIGDICGVVSGAAGVAIALSISEIFGISNMTSNLIVTGIVASLTIGGKSLEKPIAINNGNKILFRFAKVLSIFSKE